MNSMANKIMVIGIDGMDPRFTKYMMDKGEMPNVKKIVDAGAQREDLIMQGMHPTITPPMWATLATGAYANTHGITCYWGQSKEELDLLVYNFDSSRSQAEQLWNVFAEAGKKTLVFSWPSISWPPSSDSENLFVIDGTSPAYVNSSSGRVDAEKLIHADITMTQVLYKPKVMIENGAGCVLSDIDVAEAEENVSSKTAGSNQMRNIELTTMDGEGQFEDGPIDVCNSPIKPAQGWSTAPEDALEFTIIIHNGLVRRPALIVKNNQGVYDTVLVFKNKKEEQPLAKVTTTEPDAIDVLDEHKTEAGEVRVNNRIYTLLELQPDGSKVRMYVGTAMDIDTDKVWHPKQIYRDVVENVGYVEGMPTPSGKHIEFMEKLVLPSWRRYGKWQADATKFLINKYGIEVVFSHYHNCDNYAHNFLQWLKAREWGNDAEAYRALWEEGYRDTDAYIGQYLSLLDDGWTLFIVSDHGLICSEHEMALMGDPFGVNAAVMADIGYTVLKTDSNGNRMKEIDWSKTRAVAPRGNHIYLNIKGRDKHVLADGTVMDGIVEPEDQYELEDQIITDLYKYQDPVTGKRIISIALRNKDAAIFGLSGPECGDIIYWNTEGFNRAHGDSLSTYLGEYNTSVSPIFIGAGPGLKKGIKTDRVIRQVDFAPTLAAIAGVRMPAQCEGAPVYQIMDL